MAGVDVTENGSDKLSKMTGMIDYHTESFLERLRDETMKDVLEDMIVLCSTDDLQEARSKLFEDAKKKVHADLDRGPSGAVTKLGNDQAFEMRITDPWRLIARRSKKKLNEDACRLYLFVIGKDFKFPCNLLKRGTFKGQATQRDMRSMLRPIPRDNEVNQATESLSDGPDGEPPVDMPSQEATDGTGDMQNDATSDDDSSVCSDHHGDTTEEERASDEVPIQDDQNEVNVTDAPESDVDLGAHAETPTVSECGDARARVEPGLNDTAPCCDFSVQCMLILAPPLILLRKLGESIEHRERVGTSRDMAEGRNVSWDDLIEPEQVANNEHNDDDEASAVSDGGNGDDDAIVLVEHRDFEHHVELTVNTFADHDQRLTTLDNWNCHFEHRIDVIDAVVHEKMRMMKERQEEADDEIRRMRSRMNDFFPFLNVNNDNPRQGAHAPEGAVPARGADNANAKPLPQRVNNGRGGRGRPGGGRGNAARAVATDGGRPSQQPAASGNAKSTYGRGNPPMDGDRTTRPEASGSKQGSNARRPNVDSSTSGSRAAGPPVGTGARPKAAATGNNYCSSQVNSVSNGRDGNKSNNGGQTNQSKRPGTYAAAAAADTEPWNIAMNKKRKRERTGSGGNKPRQPLKGFSNKTTRELSVQGLCLEGFGSLEEIEDGVIAHCRERKIDLIFARVFRKKHEFKTVGCKIALNECDATTVMGDDFWPENVSARKWHPNTKGKGDVIHL